MKKMMNVFITMIILVLSVDDEVNYYINEVSYYSSDDYTRQN